MRRAKIAPGLPRRRETPLTTVLDVILPIFGLLAFGYAATFSRVFGEAAAAALASFVFYFAIPVLLFRHMATTALPEVIAWGYLSARSTGAPRSRSPSAWRSRGPRSADPSSGRRSSALAARSATRSCSASRWC